MCLLRHSSTDVLSLSVLCTTQSSTLTGHNPLLKFLRPLNSQPQLPEFPPSWAPSPHRLPGCWLKGCRWLRHCSPAFMKQVLPPFSNHPGITNPGCWHKDQMRKPNKFEVFPLGIKVLYYALLYYTMLYSPLLSSTIKFSHWLRRLPKFLRPTSPCRAGRGWRLPKRKSSMG